MNYILSYAEDLVVYLLLAWVFFTYKRMYRRHTITFEEYKFVRIASWAGLVLITLDVVRRIVWPPF